MKLREHSVKINGLFRPVIDTVPKFSWKLIADKNGESQSAYRLVVSASPDFANLGVATPVEWFHAADKKYVDSKMLVFTGKTVAVSKWSANTTYSAQGYGFRASVACAGVTASHRPDVAFGAADAVGGNFAPFSESYAGGVYIYCKTKPTATVTIPSIVCIKGA